MADTGAPGYNATFSMEGIIITHYMRALDRLQDIICEKDGFDQKRFEMQVLMLIRLLPNKKKQTEIIKAWLTEEADPEEPEDMTAQQRVVWRGGRAVTEIVEFICDAFELTHSDITGPATSAEWVPEGYTVPPMPEGTVISIKEDGTPEIVVGNVVR